MTYEEAIEAIKIKGIQIDGNAVRVANFFEGISVAEKALEKQIPKKPIAKKEEYEIVYDCPCCGRYFVSVLDGDLCGGQKYNYCCTCGQAIDWSDGE